jgi:hypothetical protein
MLISHSVLVSWPEMSSTFARREIGVAGRSGPTSALAALSVRSDGADVQR